MTVVVYIIYNVAAGHAWPMGDGLLIGYICVSSMTRKEMYSVD